MARTLKTDVLDQAGRDYARLWRLRDVPLRRSTGGALKHRPVGPTGVMANLYDIDCKDEFDVVVKALKGALSEKEKREFDRLAGSVFTPRSEDTLRRVLADKLALDMDGQHIPGRRGANPRSVRVVGNQVTRVLSPFAVKLYKHLRANQRMAISKPQFIAHYAAAIPGGVMREKFVAKRWPIFWGEAEERARIAAGERGYDPDPGIGQVAIDALPPLEAVMAASMGLSNEVAQLGCDAIVDNLEEGSDGGVLIIYGDTRATDVDTAVGGQTALSVHGLSDPAFGNAADASPGATATAAAIASDTILATDTATWFRASSSNDNATPLDDHIDGNVGTADADMIANTAAFVMGAGADVDSWTVTLGESP